MGFDYYTQVKRSMFAAMNEVGAKPFALFQYYRTWETAEFIAPKLEEIAKDLGMLDKQGKPSKSAVSNLKKVLIEKKWIDEINGKIILLKFQNYSEKMKESSEKMKESSEKMNEAFRKNERLYKEENNKENNKKNNKEIRNKRESRKNGNGKLSAYTQQEAARYVDHQIATKQLRIRSDKHGYVSKLLQSGTADGFIQIFLSEEEERLKEKTAFEAVICEECDMKNALKGIHEEWEWCDNCKESSKN